MSSVLQSDLPAKWWLVIYTSCTVMSLPGCYHPVIKNHCLSTAQCPPVLAQHWRKISRVSRTEFQSYTDTKCRKDVTDIEHAPYAGNHICLWHVHDQDIKYDSEDFVVFFFSLMIQQDLSHHEHLPESLGLSLSSLETARKTSSVKPFFIAPSGMVRLTPVKSLMQGEKLLKMALWSLLCAAPLQDVPE